MADMYLTTFQKSSKEYQKLTLAATCLNLLTTENKEYVISTTFFDYGQNWIYTTILAINKDEQPDSVLYKYQALTPKDQKTILTSDIDGIVKWAKEKIKKQ